MRETGLHYTFTAGSNVVPWNPPAFHGDGWYVEEINASCSGGAVSASRGQQGGSYVDAGFSEGLRVVVKLLNGADGATAREQHKEAHVAALLECVSGEAAELTWTSQAGVDQRLAGLRLIDGFAGLERAAGTLKTSSFQLLSPYPYAESAEATIVDSSSLSTEGSGWSLPLILPVALVGSSGGTLTYANGGTVAHRPTLQIHGPIDRPRIANTTTGRALVFTGSIAVGDYWEIDLFERSVVLNGGTTSVGGLDLSQSEWWDCPRGDSTLQLTGLNAGATTKLRAFQRSAWG